MRITTAHISDVRAERLNIVAPLICIQNSHVRDGDRVGSFPQMASLQGVPFKF